MAGLLREARERAETEAGGRVTLTVISVPVSYGSAQRTALLDAARAAGLDSVRLIGDAMAAVVGHTEGRGSTTCLVYGLGYGGFELGLIRGARGRYRALGHESASSTGGRAFDDAALTGMLRAARRRANPARLEEADWLRLRARVERIREELCASGGAAVHCSNWTSVAAYPHNSSTTARCWRSIWSAMCAVRSPARALCSTSRRWTGGTSTRCCWWVAAPVWKRSGQGCGGSPARRFSLPPTSSPRARCCTPRNSPAYRRRPWRAWRWSPRTPPKTPCRRHRTCRSPSCRLPPLPPAWMSAWPAGWRSRDGSKRRGHCWRRSCPRHGGCSTRWTRRERRVPGRWPRRNPGSAPPTAPGRPDRSPTGRASHRHGRRLGAGPPHRGCPCGARSRRDRPLDTRPPRRARRQPRGRPAVRTHERGSRRMNARAQPRNRRRRGGRPTNPRPPGQAREERCRRAGAGSPRRTRARRRQRQRQKQGQRHPPGPEPPARTRELPGAAGPQRAPLPGAHPSHEVRSRQGRPPDTPPAHRTRTRTLTPQPPRTHLAPGP